jgi:hypothetical protein
LLDKDAPLSEHNQQLCHILALAFVKIRAKETRRSSLWLGRLNRFMSIMTIIKQHRITPEDCRANPDWLYVFGDNMQRWGNAGQAIIRGQRNAVGIPTKWAPRKDPGAYFSDDDWDKRLAIKRIDEVFARLESHCKAGGTVVLPSDGIGTGLGQLPTRAPKLYEYICNRIRALENA